MNRALPSLRVREVVGVCRRQPEWYRESRLFVPGAAGVFILAEGEKLDYEEDDFRRAAHDVAEFL